MIRGIFHGILVLAFCLVSLLLPATAGAITDRGASSPSGDEGNSVSLSGTEVPPLEGFARAGNSARDEASRVAQAKSGKNEKRKQKFIDEDGDGYNDQVPDTAAAGRNSGTGGANSNSAGDQGKNGNGSDNSQDRGLKKGQEKSNGQGINGALERGIKRGQNNTKETPTTIGNQENVSNKGNIKNNGNNRFGRNYDKYNQPSTENKGGTGGRDK